MNSTIKEKLHELERTHNIRILFACESGSRAWGFPSPDSDYDVRFVYAHHEDWYFSLHEKNDVLELPVNELLDINGWDVRKALRLAAKSNPVIFEWLQSPIFYAQDEPFTNGFRALAPQCFSPISGMYHYLSMAKKKYEECVAEPDVKLKRYMYCLRATLSALWIAQHKSIPPMEIAPLMKSLPDVSLCRKIDGLIAVKASKEESYRHPHDAELEQFLAESIAACEAAAPALPAQRVDYETLDGFFRNTLRR